MIQYIVMNTGTLLEIDCQNIRFTHLMIEEMISKKQLKCGKCAHSLDLESSSLKIPSNQKSKEKPQLQCYLCVYKQSKDLQYFDIISFEYLHGVIKCFNMFDMKEITKVITDKIFNEIILRDNLRQSEKKQILKIIQPYFVQITGNKYDTSFTSFENKITIILYSMKEIVKKINESQVFIDCFWDQNPFHKLSQKKATYLLRLMREQIDLKLESLKNLYKIVKNTRQFKNIMQFSLSALSLLNHPLKSFLKTQSSNNIIYSLDRRQIRLKTSQECEMTQQDYDQIEQLVRLNEPLRRKPVVFRLKCPYRHQKLRIGFFFMNWQDYEVQAEYQKPFQPLQIIFNVHSYLQDDQKNETSPEIQRIEHQKSKHSIVMLNQKSQRRITMCLNTSQSFCQQEKIFAMSFKKDAKNIEAKEFDVEDGTLIELNYQHSSKVVSITNLSKGLEIYRRRFYKRTSLDMKKILIFPCVVLTGPDCSVEYILTE